MDNFVEIDPSTHPRTVLTRRMGLFLALSTHSDVTPFALDSKGMLRVNSSRLGDKLSTRRLGAEYAFFFGRRKLQDPAHKNLLLRVVEHRLDNKGWNRLLAALGWHLRLLLHRHRDESA